MSVSGGTGRASAIRTFPRDPMVSMPLPTLVARERLYSSSSSSGSRLVE